MNRICLTKVFLTSLAFACALQLPIVIVHLRSGGYEPAILSDWDEPYYLPLPFEAAQRARLSSLWSVGDRGLRVYSELDSYLPHSVSDLLVGSFASALRLSPASLGIFLDVVLFPFALSILYLLYSCLGAGGLPALVASYITLLFPWVAALSAFRIFELPISPHIQTISHNFFPSLPIFRGVYTQMSYPFFAAFLYLLARHCTAISTSLSRVCRLGLLGGLLIYLYFFAFGAAICFGAIVLVAAGAFIREGIRTTAVSMAIFGISALIVAAPGLFALLDNASLFASGASLETVPPLPYRSYWFLSPISLAACGGAAYYAYRTRSLLGLWAASIFLAEIVLINSQPILNRWLTPYHFSLFYLHPILSGIIALSLSAYLSPVSQRIFLFFTLAITLVVSWRPYWIATTGTGEASTSILERIDRLPPGESLAVLPYDRGADPTHARLEYLLMPYWIKTFTHVSSFSQFMSFSPNRMELVEKELVLGFLYLGTPQMLGWCPKPTDPLRVEDLLQGAESFHEHQRRIDCAIARSLSSIDGCALMKRHPVKYFLTVTNDVAPVPACE
ncbi:MAG: hypothetical protein EBZ48_05595 [Proteobacteria bacterium]|nr:hypothetical protein [Pseudomonadota bacterium]